jgi:hypothetical protein
LDWSSSNSCIAKMISSWEAFAPILVLTTGQQINVTRPASHLRQPSRRQTPIYTWPGHCSELRSIHNCIIARDVDRSRTVARHSFSEIGTNLLPHPPSSPLCAGGPSRWRERVSPPTARGVALQHPCSIAHIFRARHHLGQDNLEQDNSTREWPLIRTFHASVLSDVIGL